MSVLNYLSTQTHGRGLISVN